MLRTKRNKVGISGKSFNYSDWISKCHPDCSVASGKEIAMSTLIVKVVWFVAPTTAT